MSAYLHSIIDDAAWSFETAQFFVGFYAEPEDMDPTDSFEFPEDIEAVRSGRVEWFCATVRVYFKNDSAEPSDWREVGGDSLGGCAYNSVREFYSSHHDSDPMNRNCSAMRLARGGSPDAKYTICHYFPGMISTALDAARTTLRTMGAVHLRSA